MVQEIIGHEASVKFLQALLKKGVRSFLLVGPEGVGKKTIACWFSKKLLCDNKEGNSCTCRSCSLFEKRISPDFRFLMIEGKYFKIAQINTLQEAASSRPKVSDHKVFIIPCAHKMTSRAANSLLKTLEEPLEHIIIFLVSENLNQVLPTVRSRCALIDFKTLSEESIKKVLRQQGYEKDLDLAAKLSFGSVKKSLECLSGNALKIRDKSLLFLEGLPSLKLYQIFELTGEGLSDSFIDHLHLLLFDLFLVSRGGTPKNFDKEEELKTLSSFFTENFLVKALEKISILKMKARYNIDRELHIAQLLLELKALFSKYRVKCLKSS